MKTLLQFIFLFCFIFGSGQRLVISGKSTKSKTFHFDFLIHYSIESDGNTRDVLGYVNSKNPNYFLKILRLGETDVRAKLFSAEDKETFNFKVKQSTLKGELMFDFEYQDSSYLSYQLSYDHPYSFTKIDNKTLRLDIFSNKRRKKILESHTMKIGKYSPSIFPAYQSLFVHHSDLGSKMNYPENIFVEESVFKYEKGNDATVKLQEVRKIDFDLPLNN